MSKLLIVEGSNILKGMFKTLLDAENAFDYQLVGTYKEAKKLLAQSRYEFAVVEHKLKDAPHGEIIALFNKHNIAPLIFTSEIDEDFFEAFESANISDYILKEKFNNVASVIKKLKQFQENKKVTILTVNDSHIYTTYLKHNLGLQSFKVITTSNNEEALQKIKLHPELKLMIINNSEPYVNALALIKDIKAEKNAPNLKILVLSEETNSYETATLLNAGADDYLVKDFSRKEFYVRVYQNTK